MQISKRLQVVQCAWNDFTLSAYTDSNKGAPSVIVHVRQRSNRGKLYDSVKTVRPDFVLVRAASPS